ncbi:MAG: HAMP domain-containing histidine kinase [Bdellovibrionales bacterium]|nr:HAMP domain-containing histidine kinase [Bdellovibrionales bacterium]
MEKQGAQLDPFFEKSDTPSEFLKDPSCWLPIEKMENFLQEIAAYTHCDDCENFFREIGHNNHELRAWGVLDSVLKMVESPLDIFSQPDRFLSYFLSPHPEVRVSQQSSHSLHFSLDSESIYPFVLSYITGAVEGLPNYMGLPTALIETVGDEFKITWSNDQESLFDEEEKRRRQFHPEIVQSVMQSLQDQQQSAQQNQSVTPTQNFNPKDFEKMVSDEVERRMSKMVEDQKAIDETVFKVKNDFYKMYDYFTRAQQLITLISGTARKASVREAMRRVDWEYVQKEFPQIVESACDSILALKDQVNQFEISESSLLSKDEIRERVDLNQLIDSVVEQLPMGEKTIKVDKHWLLDKEIDVEPSSFSQAIKEVLQSSVSQTRKGGEVRIVTRPNGRKVEIEITDTGVGFADESLREVFNDNQEHNLKQTQDIIRRHKGNISISSQQGIGSTYLIEIPT